MSDQTISELFLEAEIDMLIAPPIAKEALDRFGHGVAMFILLNGRAPSEDALNTRLATQIRDLGGNREDAQWCVEYHFAFRGLLTTWDGMTK